MDNQSQPIDFRRSNEVLAAIRRELENEFADVEVPETQPDETDPFASIKL